ncbi:CIA30 family protein [Gloeomargarita lithophora]|nr:CIA30 family protein [Gloeomargarita lithophora]
MQFPDVGRLWQTVTYFEALPLVACLQRTLGHNPPPATVMPQGEIMMDLSQPTGVDLWGALDDVVMGGMSRSSLVADPAGARFEGMVTTQNNGGFASVRTRNLEPPLDLSGTTGLTLRVRGDGKRYKLLVRDSSSWDSLAYGAQFDTQPATWITVKIPFADLVPVFRAKTVPSAPPMVLTQVISLQLMLSKFAYDGQINPTFQPGDFRLQISTIGTYTDAPFPTL